MTACIRRWRRSHELVGIVAVVLVRLHRVLAEEPVVAAQLGVGRPPPVLLLLALLLLAQHSLLVLALL